MLEGGTPNPLEQGGCMFKFILLTGPTLVVLLYWFVWRR